MTINYDTGGVVFFYTPSSHIYTHTHTVQYKIVKKAVKPHEGICSPVLIIIIIIIYPLTVRVVGAPLHR